jgi:D-3-phosphoglycerate dehydrogenase
MAEYTLGLVLSSLLQIHNYHHYMRDGEAWPRANFGRTRILQDRKVGVIGVGLIGRGIIELFKCLTGDIVVHSKHLSDEAASELGVKNMDLDQLFAECEIIVLAGGYTPETFHMIGPRQFQQMGKDALFINIARGKMVDQEAMIEAVKQKEIYLALDVFEEEPLAADSPLRESDRVLITPHRANAPVEFEQRWQCLADELELFYTGKSPRSALTLERARTMSES